MPNATGRRLWLRVTTLAAATVLLAALPIAVSRAERAADADYSRTNAGKPGGNPDRTIQPGPSPDNPDRTVRLAPDSNSPNGHDDSAANRVTETPAPYPPPQGWCDTSSAFWSAEPGKLHVTTRGSGSCPVLAVAAMVTGDAEITVELHETALGRVVCSADMSPSTSTVTVPDGVDNGEPVTVWLGVDQSVVVEPRSAPGQPGPLACVGGLNPPVEIWEGEFEPMPVPLP